MHLLAEAVLIRHLIGMGALHGDPQAIQDKRLGAIFFPHGLGHLFGLLVHDVGGYNKGQPARSDKFGLKSLRMRRQLKAGMTITVEPGLYFIPFLI
jgi:Xaa-Pro dipeptidase